MAAQSTHAELAPKRPEGMWAGTVNLVACLVAGRIARLLAVR
jgi:hypothetical protein